MKWLVGGAVILTDLLNKQDCQDNLKIAFLSFLKATGYYLWKSLSSVPTFYETDLGRG